MNQERSAWLEFNTVIDSEYKKSNFMKHLISIIGYISIFIILSYMTNCDSEFQKDQFNIEGKATASCVEVTGNYAIIRVKLSGILNHHSKGVYTNYDNFKLYYGTSDNPLEMTNFAEAYKFNDGSLTGGGLGFSLMNLQPNTTYHIALKVDTLYAATGTFANPHNLNVAVPKDSGIIIPEGISSFTTLTGDIKAVDLGLSVMWAENDLGSDEYWYTPTSPWSTSNIIGMPPALNIAGTEYDPVTAALGEGWRMPTAAEFQELIDNTHVSHKVDNEFGGYIVCRNIDNGKYIRFYPHAGGLLDDWEGVRWTSDVYEASSKGFDVKVFTFTATDTDIKKTPYTIYTKYPIRPVHVK